MPSLPAPLGPAQVGAALAAAPVAKRVRMLFVDDEPRVLEGLRRSLRKKHQVWDVAFAQNGAAAMALLQSSSFDVVVSDMHMPVVDGEELLSRVAKLQPDAVRIVLSGEMDDSEAARAATMAHRFLAKPCEPEVLDDTLTRTLELRARLRSEALRHCVGGMAQLPSLPSTCMALNAALGRPHTSLQEIRAIIEGDVGMSAKALQLVNSAFFGLPRAMTSVEHAIRYLGLSTIRNLTLVHSVFQELDAGDLLDIERMQQQALLASRFAERLLPDRQRAQVAATAALLHDVGALAWASRMPAEHRKNLCIAAQERRALWQVEQARFGVTHADVGAYLLGLWALPYDVTEAVATHHAPWESFNELDARTAVRFAVALAHELTGPADADVDRPPPNLAARLGIEASLERLRADFADIVDNANATSS